MKFRYIGVDKNTSQSVNGDIEAISELDALRQLSTQRIEAFKLEQVEHSIKGRKRVKKSDLVIPLQELATLTDSGVTLVSSLHALGDNKEHVGVARGFKKIASLVESGESFSSAISQSDMPFPAYLQYLASAGETGGNLALALRKASEQMNYEQTVANDLRSALTYPIVLISAGIAAMLIIFFAVVPNFSNMLQSGKELPLLAWSVLSAGDYANKHPLIVFGSIASIITVLVITFSNQKVKVFMLNLLLRTPIIGDWLAEQDAAKWASLVGAMLGARVELVTSLRLATSSIGFQSRKVRAEQLLKDVQSGENFTASLDRANLLPGSSLNLVSVGDRTGQLAKMMEAVANLHDEACKRRMKRVMTLVEPIAILVVGVLIGTMIMGIVQAITVSTDIAI